MMASTLILLLQMLLISLVSASHHFGGTATFTYNGQNNDGSYKVVIRRRSTFDGCNHYHRWNCATGICGISSIQRTTIDTSNNAPTSNSQWCETEAVDTRTVVTDKPFQLRSASCCWIPTRNLCHYWRLNILVDLGRRSDTGKPNRSPDIAILPFLRVPKNCPRTYKVISFDPDNDNVRCRHGNLRNVDCFLCNPPSGFTLEEDSCTLHYNQTSAHPRVFGFEMVVEDFPRKSISLSYSDDSSVSVSTANPLSKLPLQFSLLVDPAAPSCLEGLYIPKYVYPTPQNGEHIQAVIGKEVEIRIKAEATTAQIHGIIISGPSHISKHKTTHNEFVLRWTPTADDLGNHYAVCFAVESVPRLDTTTASVDTTAQGHDHSSYSQSEVYQSDMRCVQLDIVAGKVIANVTCNETAIKVEVDKSSFPGLHEDHLQLNDPSNTVCSLQTHSNSTHVIGMIPLNACGTQIEEDEDYLIFKNQITPVDSNHDVITRKHLLCVQFYCQYPKKGNVSLAFIAHRKKFTIWERGMGTFTYQFEFYHDSHFHTMFDPNSYPLLYEIGTRIYMQIEATSSVANTELFVESCIAAPYDNPNSHPKYFLIEKGCLVDPTIEIHSAPHQKVFQFSIEAFKFIGMVNQVYISCSVIMCEADNPDTRCAKGCMNHPWIDDNENHDHRRKREALIQTTNHFVSQGPLRLKTVDESGSSVNLNLSLVFITGCLLAAVGMICGAVMYKSKISITKYQLLPQAEE